MTRGMGIGGAIVSNNNVEFEDPKWVDDFRKEYTVPQTDYKTNPNNQGGMAINSKIAGLDRDAERLLRGSDGSVYYSPDHYDTFIRIK